MRIISPYLEGHGRGLLKVVNFLTKMEKLLLPENKSAWLVKYYNKLSEKVILPNSFNTINGIGNLFPSIRLLHRRIRKNSPNSLHDEQVDLDFMPDEYYTLRKLTKQGFPEKEILENLGLGEVSEALCPGT
jgi:hypothetical protein